jgi:D-3-phosphoglycerate dehydrogenase
MAKVLVAGIVNEAALALLEGRSDIEFEVLANLSAAELEARIADLDGLLVRLTPVTAAVIDKADRLKVVSRYGVGYDSVDVAALTRRGIPLTVVGEANSVSVAEHAIGMMVAVSRRMVECDRAVHNGNYGAQRAAEQSDLAGKTVLVVGFGRIGTRVAKRCAAFEMDVIVADPYVPRRSVEDAGYRYVGDLREALEEADFVTLHMPAHQDKRPELTRAEFDAMKPGAYFINTARGSLVDEEALAAALNRGHLRGAGLDVTREEPPAPDCPLLAVDNVIFTPHSAALTLESNRRMSIASVQNVLDGIDGRLRREMVINKEVLES